MKFFLSFALVLSIAPDPASALANPASVFCRKAGGKSEIRRTAAGSYGVCRLPNGRVVDEWTYFREHHRDGR
jgi:putative hemolysin